MKFAGVNIDGHSNIWCEDQHRLTTKKFFYLELKRNRQFYRLSAEESQSVFPRPLSQTQTTMKHFCIKIICQSSHTHCHFNTTSDKIYMTNKIGLWNIPLIDSNIHQYAMVVLSQYIIPGSPFGFWQSPGHAKWSRVSILEVQEKGLNCY
jgi:hypothetical protein